MIATTTPRRTTEPFREEHAAIKEHLRHMSQMIQAIPGGVTEVQKQNMTRLVEALKEHILLHAEWEEKVLYPVIDQKTGSGTPDAALFVRQADQLFGLILAHFEDEEEVLLPVLDESMTPEEFEREITSQGHPHGH